ncbi:MAG: adenosylcobinamide-GDP ribazoletransferase [Lentisphaerae bacterium]|jgi:adenosylcobinamide-GDP ribazoletransferase|nr:adenosylcobinamide-GDP ribazoletransferase [Lentisphaerota bacterium]MBT5609712.1 adenosylcobinamide-GDP ribazoletransferase [Lentisphaerota bacterium]MBT7061448.1 adenosylcobinamide-GDP ribazoletransferase [Lentisphaerota bacterium]MBT7844196.1 adenosylcobinamide-GDP ribazoletransferase [Lentisphaerota bacterium]
MIFFRACRLALSFLTRIPVGRMATLSDQDWRWMVAGFPLCGYLLGVAAIAVPAYGFRPAGCAPLYVLLVACICVSVLAYLTRGLHLDGMADMCDGLGGGFDCERRLAIMKDPTVGSFGALGLILLLAVKTAALGVLLGEAMVWPCVAVVVLARFFLALLTGIGTYARKTGTAARTVGNVAPAALALAAVLSAPVCFLPGIPLCAAAMFGTTILLKLKADRALGGITGDILGANCELCETVGYVTVALQMNTV